MLQLHSPNTHLPLNRCEPKRDTDCREQRERALGLCWTGLKRKDVEQFGEAALDERRMRSSEQHEVRDGIGPHSYQRVLD